MKMKKLFRSLAITTSLLTSTLYAAPHNACDYTDTFYITNESAPAGTQIIGPIDIKGDGLIVNATSTSFAIKGLCSGQATAAAIVTLGTSPENTCTLTIKDGQFYMDPVVETIKCKGNFIYNGIKYDGIFTYRYKLIFSSNKL